jgi:hypothetical protein
VNDCFAQLRTAPSTAVHCCEGSRKAALDCEGVRDDTLDGKGAAGAPDYPIRLPGYQHPNLVFRCSRTIEAVGQSKHRRKHSRGTYAARLLDKGHHTCSPARRRGIVRPAARRLLGQKLLEAAWNLGRCRRQRGTGSVAAHLSFLATCGHMSCLQILGDLHLGALQTGLGASRGLATTT